MSKLLSIIVPTYNMEKYLHKCLDSLIVSKENMERLEILVVNDGSTDSSSQIAHEYEAKYPQTFRVIDKENGNYGSCINRGLEEATSKYIKVLDADDSFYTYAFDEFISYLKDKECDIVLTDFCAVDNNGNIIKKSTYNLPIDQSFGLHKLSKETIYHLHHYHITYRTEILKNMKYMQTEGISYTDNEWVFKPMAYVQNIIYCKLCIYSYLRGRQGQTFDPKVLMKNYHQRMTVMKSMAKFYVETCDQYNTDTQWFMYVRLMRRLSGIYKYYLAVHSTIDGNERLKVFDNDLKEISSFLYDSLDSTTNKLGWHYIRNWRKHKYNRNTLMLRLLRLKNRIKSGSTL